MPQATVDVPGELVQTMKLSRTNIPQATVDVPVELVQAINLVLVITLKHVLELLLLKRVAHGEAIVLKAAHDTFGLLHHAVDLGLRKTTLIVGDGDLNRWRRCEKS